MQTGQYDNNVPRGFALLHDASKSTDSHLDVQIILQQLRSSLPAQSMVHLVSINSLPSINVAQPDIWTRWMRPRWYERDIPALAEAMSEPLPLNPNTGKTALGWYVQTHLRYTHIVCPLARALLDEILHNKKSYPSCMLYGPCVEFPVKYSL